MTGRTISAALEARSGTPVAGPPAALAITDDQAWWDSTQLAALKQLGIRDAEPSDLLVFLHYCQRTQLDPFSRQIYMIGRRERQGDDWVMKQTIQVGIDGFRVIARRAADKHDLTIEYEDTEWADPKGGWHPVWVYDENPMAARVVVLRSGLRFPGIARFSSYAAKNRQGDLVSQWKAQPDHMIEKVAEAFALRRAFPLDLAGLYTDEEMPLPDPESEMPVRRARKTAKATVIPPEPETVADAAPPARADLEALRARLAEFETVSPPELICATLVDHPLESLDALDDDEIEHIMSELEPLKEAHELVALLEEMKAATQ